jgi:hypothetical protein
VSPSARQAATVFDRRAAIVPQIAVSITSEVPAMALTAATVIVGAGVIPLDPIFQVLAVSLISRRSGVVLPVAHGRAGPVLHPGSPVSFS